MGNILNRRRVMGGKSLPYDAEIEYLEADYERKAYIMTDVVLANHSITARIQQIAYQNDCALFGAWNPSNPKSIFQVTFYTNRYYFGCSTSNERSVAIPNGFNTDWHDYELSPSSFKLDGSVLYTETAQYRQNGLKCAIFGRNVSGAIEQSTISKYTRISTFIVKDLDTDEIVFNGIPVRIGSTGYMYDKVSGQLFGSAGAGNFTLGPDKKQKPMVNVEYIESRGPQWIDTGIDGSLDGLVIELDIAIFEHSNNEANFFGSIGYSTESLFYSGHFKNLDGIVLQIGSPYVNYHITDYNRHTHVYDSINKTISFDNDVISATSLNWNGVTVRTFGLMARNDGDIVPTNPCKSRLYKAKFTRYGTVIANFSPVRIGGIGYLYDQVSGQLFGNSGYNSFIVGPDV